MLAMLGTDSLPLTVVCNLLGSLMASDGRPEFVASWVCIASCSSSGGQRMKGGRGEGKAAINSRITNILGDDVAGSFLFSGMVEVASYKSCVSANATTLCLLGVAHWV